MHFAGAVTDGCLIRVYRTVMAALPRYYQSDLGRNKPISTEITGYAATALIYSFEITGDEEYLDR